MKYLFLFGLILLGSTPAQAQWLYFTDFSGLEIAPCPFAPNKITQQLQGWLLYQTLNGNWDGPVDSSRCISVETNANAEATFVRLSQIDAARPLFLRNKPGTLENLNLRPNHLYTAAAAVNITPGDTPNLQIGSDCFQDLCSGLFVGIGIPGLDGGAEGATRFHTGLFKSSTNHPNEYWIDSCFPSEKFDTQSLKELVLKFTFNPSLNWNSRILKLYELEIMENGFDPGLIDHAHAGPNHFNGTAYDLNVAEAAGAFRPNYLMVYTAPTYPSVQNPSYIEARPEPNSSVPQTINLTVDPFQYLEIQPFTYLRGALVQGSDSIRHRANLLNNGGEFCINGVDLVFSNGDEYRHAKGLLVMNSAFSCLQFREQSALRVMENATLHYGNDGTGMLALCAGSHLILEKNASFVLDGVLNIAECDHPYAEAKITVDLLPGSVLSFTPEAVLTNRFSKGQQLRLQVRMLGGTIDDSALDPAERQMIERVYPVPTTALRQNIVLSPNPVMDQAVLQYIAADHERLDLQWFDVNGQLIGNQYVGASKGLNRYEIQPPEKPGMYLLKISNQKQQATLKVVRF